MSDLTLVLEGERPISWNKFWAMRHWSTRSREKQRVQNLVRAALPHRVLDGEGWPLREPAAIVITAFMEKRLIDVDNLCTKVYVDALKGWVIEDDDPRHVVSVIPRVVQDRAWPRMEIKVSSVYADEIENVRRGTDPDRAGRVGGVAPAGAASNEHSASG